MNKQSRTASGVVLQLVGLVEGLTTPHSKKETVTKPYDKPRNWTDSLERPRQTNKVMRTGTWNVTNLYRTGAVILVAR